MWCGAGHRHGDTATEGAGSSIETHAHLVRSVSSFNKFVLNISLMGLLWETMLLNQIMMVI